MPHLTGSKPSKPGTSRFSKVLPAIPGVTVSGPDPMPNPPSKDLPDLPPPPPPPHSYALNSSPSSPSPSSPANGHDDRPLPPPKQLSSDRLAAPAPQKMAIPRRPVGVDKPGDSSKLSPQAEPSPTLSISSLISAYSRPFDSPTASSGNSQLPTPSASSRETSPASRDNNGLQTPASDFKSNSFQSSVDRSLPPVPPKDNTGPISPRSASLAHNQEQQKQLSDSPPHVPAKSELWRRRPQNDSRELPVLELQHSHGSTVSTQRPSTAIKSQSSSSSTDSTPRSRQPPSVGGLPGRNIKPPHARDQFKMVESNSRPSLLQNKSSTASLTRQTVTAPGPGTNGPPTPEYQKDDIQLPVANPVISPDSPASSPQSPAKPSMSKDLPPPPPQTKTPPTDIPPRKPPASAVNTLPKAANNKAQEVDALHPSSSDTSLVTARTSASDSSGATPRSSDPSQASSRSGSQQPQQRKAMEQTPKQQRPPMDDPRIVHSEEHGPMYRGRDGTLYPEMKNLREPDPRAFKFPAWKGEPLHSDAVINAHAIKESHHNCFQKHKAMNRRVNRHYPLTCQTCGKADSEDRYACSFCHLRICEPCLKIFNNNQRNLTSLMSELARQTPLSLSSSSRPTSAFGLQA